MNEQMKKGASAPDGDFALGFQPDGVQLLHRHNNDWAELGKAPFNGDLRGGLGGFVQRLRAANAPGLALVIPEDQILYTELVLPLETNTQAALKKGLDGLTPYRVEELAFDFAPADAKPGATVKVAAVARQTLQEAEDFAVRHGFAPNRFLAAPASGQFPHTPDFGSTGLASEWEMANAALAELAEGESEQSAEPVAAADVEEPQPEPVDVPVAALKPQMNLAVPVVSRITAHVVPEKLAISAPVQPTDKPATASVNLASIVLPGDKTEAEEVAEAADAVEGSEAETAVRQEEAKPRALKPLPERARKFHERASEARKARPAPEVTSRAAAAPGRRSGLSGALPLIGLLILGLGISAVMMGREPDPIPAAVEAQVGQPVVEQQSTQVTEEAAVVQSTGTTSQTSATATVPQERQPVEAPQPQLAESAPPLEEVVAEGQTAAVQSQPDASPTQVVSLPDDIVPLDATTSNDPTIEGLPSDSAIAAAVSAAYATAQLPAEELAQSQPPAAATTETPDAISSQADTAPTGPASASTQPAPAVTRSARPISRPQNLVRRASAPSAAPARAETAAPSSSAAPSASSTTGSRPASRPSGSTASSSESGTSANPGAPASATLVSSARPKSAPSRSEPASQAADVRPSVPRSPQPYEQRQRPEPSGTRPPPKPVTQSSIDGAAQHLLPAPRHFAMFSIRDHKAVLAHMNRPWLRLDPQKASVLVRTAEARPVRRPTRNDATTSAVDAAVSEAISEPRPAARASTAAAPATAAPARAGNVVALSRSVRPARRPGSSASTASASTAGISDATDSAVEQAIASAVSSSAAVPGRVALLPLTSSARPSWRGNRGGGGGASRPDTDSAVSAAIAGSKSEGTLAPEPEQDAGQSKAEAEAAALAERRRLDDELQRQAEQRVRERAASDARAAAQAKAAAEARARAQAEAEAAAAARRNQRYQPPEVDNEPEVASAKSAPSNGAVAGSATTKGIDLNATQLIGTVGAGKASRGLIRLRNGRIVTVRLGDKINGGQISSIGNGGLKYVKAGREYSLPILNGR